MNTKIVLGFVGMMASGKGTVAQYLKEKYGAATYRYSTMLNDLINRLHLEPNRDNLIKISESIRGTFGEDIMAKTIAKDVEEDTNNLIVVEGIRRMADIAYLSKLPNFVLIEISTDMPVRYERLSKRREKSDDATMTYDEFVKAHERSTELTIPEVASHATEHINNNGSFENLHQQLDELVKKYHAV